MIEEILQNGDITDLLINGPNQVWIDRGNSLERLESSSLGLGTAADVRYLALSLARKAKARLDDAEPIVDAQLPSGIRLNAVISPVAPVEAGALISLRTKPRRSFSLFELEEKGMITSQQRRKLSKLVSGKKNIIISGATGAGKTTLLAALIKEISDSERIVGIEEAREISSEIHPGLVLMSARRPNSEGEGEIKLSSLLKSTLRMRPDRIVLGECRGDEVREFLLALGAGYSGSFTTIHANSAEAVRSRVETLAFMAGVYTKLTENQFDQYVDAVVHLRTLNGKRCVEEILDFTKERKSARGLQGLGLLEKNQCSEVKDYMGEVDDD
jgi:pilus assembly protein CpaF